MKKRDFQRTKVYRAQWLAWSVYDEVNVTPLSKAECEALVARGSRLLSRLLKRTEPITVLYPRGRQLVNAWAGYKTMSSPTGSTWGRVISLPTWARTRPVIVHELAHHVAGLSHGHDEVFAGVFVRLTRQLIGQVEADVLRDAMRQLGVQVAKMPRKS